MGYTILIRFFPDPWLKVPKAQKSQGQGLANEVFFVYGTACDRRACPISYNNFAQL